jgi:hypothetical protein
MEVRPSVWNQMHLSPPHLDPAGSGALLSADITWILLLRQSHGFPPESKKKY